MSVRIKDLSPKAGQVSASTQIATEDLNDETGKTRKVPAADITPYTYAASDEDSPLSDGIIYTTEAAAVTRSIRDVIASLKNAPTGNTIEIDLRLETIINSNVFATIFGVNKPIIMVNEFTSESAFPLANIITGTWPSGRRMQIVLTINDSNFAATGLKVTIKS